MSTRRLLSISTGLMLLAAPVMAQSTGTTSSTTAPGAMPSHMTPAPATDTATANNSDKTSASPTYMTGDQQIRASKLIGSSVYNDQHQNIGSIDDLLLDKNHDVTNVVLSVGGFLGIGSKLVEVPYHNLHVADNSIVMPGASKESLKKMPTYTFNGAG